MNIGVHITHHYDEARVKYLDQVLFNLSAIPHDLDVFIYSNSDLPLIQDFSNIKIRLIKSKFHDFYGSRRFLSLIKTFSHKSFVSIAQHVHPYYLTWVNRKFVLQAVDQFDVQVYLEDDLGFTRTTLEYWQKYYPFCISNDYNLGFLLIEKDVENKLFCPGLWEAPTTIVNLQGRPFLLNNVNPYCAFWIYDREELKEFTKSREWNFQFKGYGVRERSAIGWHGIGMERYKGTIIPLLTMDDGSLSVDPDCAVHHLPNNYLGHDYFCKVEFPISFSQS